MVGLSQERRLYRNIIKRNQQAINREEELRERLREATAATENKKTTISQDKADELYKELCRLMEEERIYTDPQLSRDSLAERLQTNRTYLTNVVSNKTGQGIPAFINLYRIEEAVRILSDKSRADYPLKQLYGDLGFSSLSTFYKLFQSQVGMSPAAYRKSLMEMQ